MRSFIGALCLSSAVLLTLPHPGAAQTVLGLRAGYGVSNIYGTDIGSPGPKNGAVGGVWLRIPLTERLAFQAEGDLAVRGFEQVFPVGRVDLELRYVDVPVILQYHLDRGGSVSPVFSLGAVYSRLRSCEASGQTLLLSATVPCEDLNQGVDLVTPKDSDFSALLGVGLQLDLGPLICLAEIRGQLALGESVKMVIDPSLLGYGTARTGGVSIQVAAGLPLG